MHTTPEEGVQLVKDITEKISSLPGNTEVLFIPPFTHLASLAFVSSQPGFYTGAQNCAAFEKGAYTGEVAAFMLPSLGVKYVLVGHSERRSIYGEDHATLRTKTNLVLANGMIPVFCCGETLEEREAGRHFDTVKKQLEDSVFHLSPEQAETIVLAYEPVWAIGTGKTASPEQAQEIHQYIRSLLNEKYGENVAAGIPILYGGSVKASNAASLFVQADIDGALVGGASLQADEFAAIINAAN